jgi:hypothetical protein
MNEPVLKGKTVPIKNTDIKDAGDTSVHDLVDADASKRKLTPTELARRAYLAGQRIVTAGDWAGWLFDRRKKLWQKFATPTVSALAATSSVRSPSSVASPTRIAV